MRDLLDIRPEVAEALSARRPVVALESTLIAHGLPYPRNLETARRVEAVVREAGSVPATVGVTGGRLRVGLNAQEIEAFAVGENTAKASSRDLAATIAGGGDGATTVAGTLVAAQLAGIRVFATGGIGGVHRGGAAYDVSADLMELARRPVALVSAGAKAILDLAGTLELLETQGVPVIGYGTDEFPAFYCRQSGLPLDVRVDHPEAAARLMRAHWTLGLGGLLIANPPPEMAALDPVEVEALVGRALDDAQSAGLGGKRLTPFLLDRVNELSDGRTLEANIALIEANAALGAELAAALAALDRR